MNPVEIIKGDSPVILAMPHTGTYLPDDVTAMLNENGRKLADTDWHIDTLYSDLLPDVSIVRATFHRYVIDANRDPSGASLYPGQNTTTICPTTDFDNLPIYLEGQEPDDNGIENRLRDFHAPYHHALAAEIERIHNRFGIVVLYDCHSIRSNIPFLFEGRLPDFNIGTNDGRTCSADFENCVAEICTGASAYETTINGRFKGGWTTRHYGQPENNIHAIQMELAQIAYLESESTPFAYAPSKASELRKVLREILGRLSDRAVNG